MTEETPKAKTLKGTHRFKVDAKGRMSLPASFRKVLSSDLVVTPNPHDECIYVFEPESFDQWIEDAFARVGGYNPLDAAHVAQRRKLFARAVDVTTDSAGRIMLSADQRKKVGIDKDVVLVGNSGYFEVWDAKRYDQVDADVDLSLLFG